MQARVSSSCWPSRSRRRPQWPRRPVGDEQADPGHPQRDHPCSRRGDERAERPLRCGLPVPGLAQHGGPWFNNVIDWLGTSLGDYGLVQGKDKMGDKFWVQEDTRSGNVWVPQYLSFQIVGPDGDADPADAAACITSITR